MTIPGGAGTGAGSTGREMALAGADFAGRLRLATLSTLAGRGVARPVVDPAVVGVGMVHLGLGAFHRAHQAVYTEDAMAASGDTSWGIAGFGQRSRAVCDQLSPQDGLYTLLERGPDAARPRVVGALREVGSAAENGLAPAQRIGDPAVRIVTVTVTEKGYRLNAAGRLDLADPAVLADLRNDGPPRTVVGQLVAGLRLRMRKHGAGLSIMSCDNLSRNGAALERAVQDFCAALPGRDGDDLAQWTASSVTFPSSMVDRMVPASRDSDRAEAQRLLGLRDDGVVVTEPFRQWVIEDDFAAGRPAWESAGAVLTADVAPYEAAKLHLLNAAHSLLAYTGALAGYHTIAEAMSDPCLADAARRLLAEDAAPTLTVPAGFDLAGYQATVLKRFANPALGHRTAQVAADGSRKLPIRLLGTAVHRLAAGEEPQWVARAVAAWMVYVAVGRSHDGRPLPLDDPLADRLRDAAAGRTEPARLVDALLTVEEVFPPDLATHPVFRELLVTEVAQLMRPYR